jgi:hypothetical protein
MRRIDTLLRYPLPVSTPEPRHRGRAATLPRPARPAWVGPVMRIWGRSLLEAGAALGLLAVMVLAHRHLG